MLPLDWYTFYRKWLHYCPHTVPVRALRAPCKGVIFFLPVIQLTWSFYQLPFSYSSYPWPECMLLQSLVDWTKDFPESDSLFSCTKIHAATWQFCSFAIRYLPDCLDKTASRRIQCRVRANHHPPNSDWLGRQEAVLLCLVTTILWIYCHCPPKVRLPTKQHIDIANTATAATTLINTLKHAWVVWW